MCGINGIVLNTNVDINILKTKIAVMNDQIIHRGPDDSGSFVNSEDRFSVAMGMRRLAIIDLNSGKQPMNSEDGNVTIVFNGEIYNYKELRQELLYKGVKFNTSSDTEVILKLYETYGIESFKKLDGMYAFSIYDKKIKKLFIARDFFGEKPLYYFKSENSFIWASEIKSILNATPTVPKINKHGLNLFFRLTYIPAPYTIYDNMFKLESNSFLTLDTKSLDFTISNIEKQEKINKKSIPFDKARKEVKELVEKSVESRSVSDVPIGTFLSGGVDSSIVSLCLSRFTNDKINTFSVGFEKKSFDESDKAKTVAKLIGSNHHEFIINENDLENSIHDIVLNFDEPFADSSCLPTYLVSNKTSQYVKVALTGDGGDEVFGGYNKYYMGRINQKYTNLIPSKVHDFIKSKASLFLKTKDDSRGKRFKLNRLINSIDYSDNHYWDIISLGFGLNNLSSLLLPSYRIEDPFQYHKNLTKIKSPKNLTDYRIIDKNISLEGDMLVKVDRTSMFASLECRAPFLNREIWNYTNELPEEYLIKGWDKKHILKEAFKEEFPKDFLNKSKSGFGVPVGDWLKSKLRKELVSYIEPDKLKKQSIFQISSIDKLVKDHLKGKDNTFMVWTFFCFQKWYFHNYPE